MAETALTYETYDGGTAAHRCLTLLPISRSSNTLCVTPARRSGFSTGTAGVRQSTSMSLLSGTESSGGPRQHALLRGRALIRRAASSTKRTICKSEHSSERPFASSVRWQAKSATNAAELHLPT